MGASPLFAVVILLFLPAVVLGQGCLPVNNGTGLLCQGLVDGDLPFAEATGFYETIEISSTSLTRLPAESFGRASAGSFLIADNPMLASLENEFLGAYVANVNQVVMRDNPLLTSFVWDYLPAFLILETFEFSGSGLTSLPSGVAWPPSVSSIVLSRNPSLTEIPAFAFNMAVGLERLDLSAVSGSINLRKEAFFISSPNRPTLVLYAEEGPFDGVIEPDAFGNVDGGELWGRLEMALWDFPEMTFRLMIKSHFDLGSTELLIPSGPGGYTNVRDCSNCSIAWLYKDAQIYGEAAYIALVGEDNVLCAGVGAVLQSGNDNFIQEMKNCPATEMPWPGNPCEDFSGGISDTVVDPVNCACFYKCNDGEVSGHDCCPPGLVYNPANGICDWPDTVPECVIP